MYVKYDSSRMSAISSYSTLRKDGIKHDSLISFSALTTLAPPEEARKRKKRNENKKRKTQKNIYKVNIETK